MPKKQTDASRRRKEWVRRNGDFLAIGAVSALITVFFYIAFVFSVPRGEFNFGFGPEMECKNVGTGEPVCVRKR
jgi:hypothetical protein